jgi:methionyl-tRNA synthetase
MSQRTTILTAALPYANGDIHIGHMVEYVQADILVRHRRAEGERCYFVCADDAHGTPIAIRAEQEGVDPEAWIAGMKARHEADFRRFGIGFDKYHSTHSPENEALVGTIFARLEQRGHILPRTIEQLYDAQAGRFLADRYVRGSCPRCSAPDQYGDGCEKCGATYDALELRDPVSMLSGAAPVIRASDHLFFDIPAFATFLREWHGAIDLQPGVANKLEEWFESGLIAWNISRDAPYFGFEIPGHPGKYFYVWVDAPVGYLASFKALCDARGEDFAAILADPGTQLVHVIGKDIAYFHTIFWPAMLQAAGFPLPAAVWCHGFLTFAGRKMSKSRGTLIAAGTLAEALEPDLFRYFIFSMLADGLDDIDLTPAALRDRINSDLVGKIANIGSRCAALLHQLDEGRLAEELAEEARFDALLDMIGEARALIGARRFSAACRLLVQGAEETNRWLAALAPWQLARGDAGERARAAAIATQGALSFRALMIALAPVIPALSERALDHFEGMAAPLAGTYADLDIRGQLAGMRVREIRDLVQRIDDAQLARIFGAVDDGIEDKAA